jgi:hypothetical protein
VSYGQRAHGSSSYGGDLLTTGAPIIYYPNTAQRDAVWQVDENIGYVVARSPDGVWQVDENIGYVISISPDGTWQVDENITAEIPPSLVVTPLAAALLADSPAGYWPLNEDAASPSTTAFDFSGNLRHGLYVGGATKQGSSAFPGELHALLNGSSGYISLPTFPDLVSYTFEAWVTLADDVVLSSQPLLFSERRPSSGGVRQCLGVPAPTGTVGRLGHGWYQDGWGWQGITQDPSAMPLGRLQHVAVTHSNTAPVTTKIFRNGIKVVEASAVHNANPYNDGNNGYRFGASYADPVGQFWKGMLAHVVIYSSVMSEAKIAAHYAASLKGGAAVFMRIVRGRGL